MTIDGLKVPGSFCSSLMLRIHFGRRN